jgi:hypothetical protein
MLRALIDNLPDPIYVRIKNAEKSLPIKQMWRILARQVNQKFLERLILNYFRVILAKRGYADDKKILNTGKPSFDIEEEFIKCKWNKTLATDNKDSFAVIKMEILQVWWV